MVQKKENTIVTCDALDDLGRGVCHTQEGTAFIDGLLPSEKAVVVIDYRQPKRSLLFGHIQKLLTKSKDRVTPECKAYPYCGCSLTHLNYKACLLYKQQVIKDLIHKFGHMDVTVLPTIPCPTLKGYRNKVQKPIGSLKGKLVCGFYKPNTHIIAANEICESESPLSQKISHVVMLLLNDYGYTAYDEDKETGEIRHILIKTSFHYPQALVTIVSAQKELPRIEEFAKELAFKVPEVKGVILNVNPRKTNVILGIDERVIYGVSQIKDQILGHDFLISSKSFFQTNPVLLDTLYTKAIEAAHLTGKERVLDAYCGTGTIGICMADKAKTVTGIEIEHSSYEDAKENAKINNIKNIFFRNADATEFMEKTKAKFDVIVLDPPRKGTTPQFIHAVFRIKPKRVVYVSCDPSTLGRDLALFSKMYKVESVQGVDMFPTNYHIETIVGLVRKNNKID